jgi:hypothetical protein
MYESFIARHVVYDSDIVLTQYNKYLTSFLSFIFLRYPEHFIFFFDYIIMATILEHLPDEILLIICNYLSQYEIITALFGLNNRLNCTISQFLQSLVLSTENNSNLNRSRQLLSMIGLYIQSLTIKYIHLSSADISLASNIQELTFMHTQPDHIPVIFDKNKKPQFIFYF